MIVVLGMAAALVQPAALPASEPHGVPVALAAEEDHIALVGDSLAAIVGELEGDATPGATIRNVLSALQERLERTSCRRAEPISIRADSPDVTCNAPDVEGLFPYYAALRRATTPTEHDRDGRRLLEAYEVLLREAPDVTVARPDEDEAPHGLLHLLFPFGAWDEKVGIPHHQVHFPFVPVCNLVVAVTGPYAENDAAFKQLGQAGNESSQRQACLDEFARRQRSSPDAAVRQGGL